MTLLTLPSAISSPHHSFFAPSSPHHSFFAPSSPHHSSLPLPALPIADVRAKHMNAEYAHALLALVDQRNAETLYRNILELKGFWLKIGQYLSCRSESLPAVYIKQLSKLQDAVPAKPEAEVRKVLEAELGGVVEDHFTEFSPESLACASIAQVHYARLSSALPSSGGRPRLQPAPGRPESSGNDAQKEMEVEVAVKVQHTGIAELMRQDMANMRIIFGWLESLGMGSNLDQIVQEYQKETSRELDFGNEAVNMARVAANMAAANIPIKVPKVIFEASTSSVLTMEFMEGVKITQADATLEELQDVAQQIVTSFAHQIFVDGFFNADPHPGNMLVHRDDTGKLVPVLLDFGLVKELPTVIRLSFAKMIWAAKTSDFSAMMDSFEEMGLKLGREDSNKDMQGIFFLLRETKPAAQAHSEFKQRAVERREAMQQNKQAKAEKKKLEAAQKKQNKKGKKSGGLEAYPSELIMFSRALLLLRGLCATLSVRVNFLDIFAEKAYVALQANAASPAPEQVLSPRRALWSTPPSKLSRAASGPPRSPGGDTAPDSPDTQLQLVVQQAAESIVSARPGQGLQARPWSPSPSPSPSPPGTCFWALRLELA
ncbi:hypothetical protein CYMTET_30406 [Cymbomonas tetramitiformis]|uniref:ABC1 atypical kinase-like domain-containing protein n=1 Tax=Cymbomonas tetramitiformis TaxID=36881 RepID=A0AAE0FJ23_9CHLO|nr:hypothetical protein CYMTET_30406 [Cymbomonas tetramitiformis]